MYNQKNSIFGPAHGKINQDNQGQPFLIKIIHEVQKLEFKLPFRQGREFWPVEFEPGKEQKGNKSNIEVFEFLGG